MKYIIKSIVFIFISGIGVLTAQEHKTYDEKVIVVSGYEPTLKDAVKIKTDPALVDTGIIKYPIQYNISSKKLTTPFIPEKIKPAKIVGEPIQQLHRGYLKLGIGSHLMPYAECYYHNTRSKNASYGLYMNHLSSWLEIPDYGNSSYANSAFQIFGKHIMKNAALSGNIFYENNYYHYYGFNDNPENLSRLAGVEKMKGKDYAQSFNNVGFHAAYQSRYSDVEKLHHSINFDLADLAGRYGINELSIKLKANLNKRFQLLNEDGQTLGLNFKWECYADKQDSAKMPAGWKGTGLGKRIENTSLFDVNPYLRLYFYGFDVNAGLHAYFGVSDSVDFKIYPDITASRSFFDQIFLKMGITGSYKRASLNSLRLENPYISNLSTASFVNNPFNFFGRIGFALEKYLDLNLDAVYSVFKHAPLFGIDSSFVLQNIYVPIYDDYNQFKVGGELAYEEEGLYKLNIGYYYYAYSVENEEKAWYKPAFELTLGGKYMIQDKFIFGLNAGFLGKMNSYSWKRNDAGILAKETGKLKNRFDVNLSAEYRYSKRLSFFFLLNNIANQQYFQWTSYPSQRMNAMLGLTFGF